MRIIISPAKKMNVNTDLFPCSGTPQFMEETEELLSILKSMSYDELKEIWNCSDALAELNYERVQHMDLYNSLTPAIISYEGIQYQYMAPEVFTDDALKYVEKNLRILSGFYGVVKPFDGITPYRLEMQARLGRKNADSLYSFWGKKISDSIFEETDTVINLASKEYSKCVEPYVTEGRKFITCVFGEMVADKKGQMKLKEKATLCKMARGEMVRFMAENAVENTDEIKKFDRLGFKFTEELSDGNTFTFVKQEELKC